MRHLVLPVLLLAAFAAAPATTQAAKPWGTVETVSRAPGLPSAAIDPRGVIVLAWNGSSASARNGAFGARRTPRRGFGEPFALRTQRSAVGDVRAQATAGGDVIVAWRRFLESNHRMEATTVRSNGARVGPISLSGPGSSAFGAAFAAVAPGAFAAGPVLTWWRREADRAQLARAVGGRLLASRNATIRNAPGAAYAQRPDGRLLAASTEERRVLLHDAGAGDAFGPPVTLVAGRGPFRDADVAVNAAGTIAVAWREFDGRTYRARAAVLAAGARAFNPAETVSREGERAASVQVAVTAEGAVAVAYLSTAPGDDRQGRDGRLRIATLGAAPRTLTAGRQTAAAFALESDAWSDVTVAWERDERGLGGAIFARTFNPLGRLGARHKLTRTGEDGYGLDLAVGPRGDALAAWVTGDGERLRAVRRPVTR